MVKTLSVRPQWRGSSPLDRAVAAFQASWAAAGRPRLEDYLADIEEPDKSMVFRELLSIELHEISKAGGQPEYEAYAARFPSQLDVVEELLLATDSFKVSVASTMSRCDLAADSEKPAVASGLPSTSSRYRYIKLLGRGGFGEVWRAHDELLGRDVALKGPRCDRNSSQRALAAFIEEARKGSQLRQMCERVVNVLDIVDEGGFCFIVMELMQGGSLANRIKAGPVPLAEAAGTVAEIAEVLARLHSRDYVHRDIKPANVLFDESGKPYLADLGLAASAEDLLDEPDVALGTLLYMPLEQAESRSNQVDGRADIYSLGVLFYQLLTGRLPHLARTRPEYIKRLKDPDGPKPPRQVDANIPVELERICLRCLQTHAKDRYQTAADIARDIRRWERSQTKRRRLGYRLPLVLAAAVALLVSAFFIRSRISNDRPSLALGDPPVQGGSGSDLTVAEASEGAIHYVTELMFPGDVESTWTLIDSGLGIHVTSTLMSLLGIAEIEQGGNGSFEVNLHQLDWAGRVGVFVGHRVDEAGNGRFELIELENWDGTVRWKRSVRSYSPSGVLITSDGLSEQTVAEPKRGAKRLLIQVRDGVVTEIAFCGELLAGLTTLAPAEQRRVQDCSGDIGLFNFQSTSSFSDFRIDGERIQLRKRSD